ncbi:hypothetical protein Hanom_Chr12g01118851 [Helianthus anomalus]
MSAAAGLDGERQATASGDNGSGYVCSVHSMHILFWFDSGNPRHLGFFLGVKEVQMIQV